VQPVRLLRFHASRKAHRQWRSAFISGLLYALHLDDDILSLAKEGVLGKALQDLNLKKRTRASKKE